ncbi:hypothetical protein MMPV_009354 [Pyropia vietnamensis]
MATFFAADAVEQTLRALAADLTALEAEVAPLRAAAEAGDVGDAKEFRNRCTILSERLTQCIIRIDSVEVSREAAAAALRAGDRALTKRLAVLLTRRKRTVRRANCLGDTLDALAQGRPPPPRASGAA